MSNCPRLYSTCEQQSCQVRAGAWHANCSADLARELLKFRRALNDSWHANCFPQTEMHVHVGTQFAADNRCFSRAQVLRSRAGPGTISGKHHHNGGAQLRDEK